MVRLGLLLAVLAALALFALQNAAPPPIALVFLGVRSPAFPLSVWLLAAFALGVIASFLLRACFELYSYSTRSTTAPAPRRPAYAPEPPLDNLKSRETVAPPRPEPPRYTPEVKTTIQPPEPPLTSARSDWETPTRTSENWEASRTTPNLNKPPTPQPAANTTPQTNVSKTDSIYDANYRVITPPYRGETPPPPTPPVNDWKTSSDDDEDWI